MSRAGGSSLKAVSHRVEGGTWGETTVIRGNAENELTAPDDLRPSALEAADPFIGRSPALAALTELLQSSSGANQAAYIVGEPGVGKTRLAEMVADAGREAGFRVVWGRPQQHAEDFPYLAYFQVASQLQVRQADGNGAVHPLDSGSGEWPSLAVDARAARTRCILDFATSVTLQAKASPTMIVVDDLQWADVASLLLISGLLDLDGCGLFLVCLTRPEESARPDVQRLLRAIRAASRVLELGGLDRDELRQLTAAILGTGTLSEREVESVWRWTNGNPLFAKTLLAHLKESGLLEEHGAEEALRRSDIPAGVAQAIRARVEGLGPRFRYILSAAAVLGDEFDRAALAAILGESEDTVAAQLGAARERHIIAPGSGSRGQRLRFQHPLYRKTLHDLLSPSEQRDLHRTISRLSEEGVLELSVEERAIHHALSRPPGVNAAAAAHCEAAARHAEELLAYESAARFWEMALDAIDRADGPRRAEILKRQGWALWAANSWKRCEETWRSAINAYERVGDAGEVAELALAIGDMLRWRQDLDGSQAWLERALAHLPPESPGRTRALSLLSSIQCVRGASDEAARTLREAVAVTEATGGHDPRIDFWLACALRMSGENEAGKAVAMRGLRAAEEKDDTHASIMLAGVLARTELADLRIDSAKAYLSKMEHLSARADTAALMMTLEVQAYQLGYAGEWRRLVELCEATMARLRLAGSYQVASAKAFWAEAQFALGNWRVAVRALTEALPALERMQDVCKVHIARILATSGEGGQALEDVRRYLERALAERFARSGSAVLADAAAAIDEPELWAPAYELALQEPAQMTLVYSPTSVDRVLGRLATRLRRWDDAVDHFERGIERLYSGGAVWELLRSYEDYASMRRARGRRGDITKAAALEIKAARLAQERGIPVPAASMPYAAASGGNMYGLSGREIEVLELVAGGLRNREIAEALYLSLHTVEGHLEKIYRKMAVSGRAEAVIRAVENGVLDRDGGARR